MHFTFVVSSILGIAACLLWLYLAHHIQKLSDDLQKRGIFKKEETLYYTYHLSLVSEVPIDPEKVTELKKRLERVSQETAPYYGLIIVSSWCTKIAVCSGIVALVLFLVEKGILR